MGYDPPSAHVQPRCREAGSHPWHRVVAAGLLWVPAVSLVLGDFMWSSSLAAEPHVIGLCSSGRKQKRNEVSFDLVLVDIGISDKTHFQSVPMLGSRPEHELCAGSFHHCGEVVQGAWPYIHSDCVYLSAWCGGGLPGPAGWGAVSCHGGHMVQCFHTYTDVIMSCKIKVNISTTFIDYSNFSVLQVTYSSSIQFPLW